MQVGVFAGSSTGRDPAYSAAAIEVGDLLARSGHGIVYGGGNVGLMGALANSALERGGDVVGVMPQHLVDREIAHHGLTRLEIVESMHERKALMSELTDGFIVLPGGAGTMDELFEMWTWTQLGLHRKPLGLLNVNGFYDKLVSFLTHLVDEGFIMPGLMQTLLVEDDPARLLDALVRSRPAVDKWSLGFTRP